MFVVENKKIGFGIVGIGKVIRLFIIVVIKTCTITSKQKVIVIICFTIIGKIPTTFK